MKKKMETTKRRVVPKFATEKEEAEWWDQNREMVSRDFEEAGRRGEVKRMTAAQLVERLASRPVTIRLAEADLALAQKQAERKGLPYQTYIKSLLHETLAEREGKR